MIRDGGMAFPRASKEASCRFGSNRSRQAATFGTIMSLVVLGPWACDGKGSTVVVYEEPPELSLVDRDEVRVKAAIRYGERVGAGSVSVLCPTLPELEVALASPTPELEACARTWVMAAEHRAELDEIGHPKTPTGIPEARVEHVGDGEVRIETLNGLRGLSPKEVVDTTLATFAQHDRIKVVHLVDPEEFEVTLILQHLLPRRRKVEKVFLGHGLRRTWSVGSSIYEE